VQAIAEWQTIASQEPANVEARVALARAYLKTGDRGRALREYRGVLALAPGHAEAKQSVAKLETKP
jgi:cytochrome c-type biogenesis protein CcmH/NrfG